MFQKILQVMSINIFPILIEFKISDATDTK